MTRVTIRSNADHDRAALIWDCGHAQTDELGRMVMGLARQVVPVVRESTAVVYVPLPGDIIEIEELEGE